MKRHRNFNSSKEPIAPNELLKYMYEGAKLLQIARTINAYRAYQVVMV